MERLPKQSLNIEGVRPSARVRRQIPARPFQMAPQPKTNTQTSLWSRLQLPLLIIGGMLGGFLVQSLVFGIVLTAGYAAIVLLLKIPSRTSFTLAFMALLTTVILLTAKPQTTLASNFATYTFLLLVVGVIALAIEARPPRRKKRPARPMRG